MQSSTKVTKKVSTRNRTPVLTSTVTPFIAPHFISGLRTCGYKILEQYKQKGMIVVSYKKVSM